MSPQINPYPRACPHPSSTVAPPLLGRVLSTAGPTQPEAELPAGPSLIVLCRPWPPLQHTQLLGALPPTPTGPAPHAAFGRTASAGRPCAHGCV